MIPGHAQRLWEEIEPGAMLPPISLVVAYEKVIMGSWSSWDVFRGHHDPHYAISQGQKTIYLNTSTLQGFADRVLTDWAGPRLFIARRKLTMTGSVYAGDTLTGEGRVEKVYRDAKGHPKIDVSITLRTAEGRACAVETTAILPSRDR